MDCARHYRLSIKSAADDNNHYRLYTCCSDSRCTREEKLRPWHPAITIRDDSAQLHSRSFHSKQTRNYNRIAEKERGGGRRLRAIRQPEIPIFVADITRTCARLINLNWSRRFPRRKEKDATESPATMAALMIETGAFAESMRASCYSPASKKCVD